MTKDQKPFPQVGDVLHLVHYFDKDAGTLEHTEEYRNPSGMEGDIESYEYGYYAFTIKLNGQESIREYQKRTKRQRLIMRYLAAIEKHNEGWVLKWEDDYQSRFEYYYDHNSKKVICDYCDAAQLKPDDWYMKDREVANKVAAEFTDAEMKLILTGKE